ncbi:MAG: hypothetical protein H6Q04_3548 [Acidobacteria bacterium]|nr:hypothetical protein [Acidobacteriota bacterium]
MILREMGCFRLSSLRLDVIVSHNMMNQTALAQNHPDFDFALEATVKSITDGKGTYADSKGVEKSVPAGSIVIYSGLKPKMDERL